MKRKAMMKKYGNNFAGKELMLFHGTPPQNVDKINFGGLNRNFAGAHGKIFFVDAAATADVNDVLVVHQFVYEHIL